MLPTYVIEPPDVLMIDAIHVVPRPPYHLRTLDLLSIQVQGTLPDAPIAGVYSVEPGGLVKLGARYGSVQVGGLTVEQAEAAITKHLRAYLKEPVVSVTLADTAAKQQIAGQHLVGPDGTVTLGSYGSVLGRGDDHRPGQSGHRATSLASTWRTRKSRSTCSPTTARSTTS